MTTVFLDESGDLGFDLTKPGTSRHFIVTVLVCGAPRAVDKAVSRTYASLTPTAKRHHHGVLHAYALQPVTRRRLLERLAGLDVAVFALKLDKRRVYTDLGNEPHVLYSYLTNVILDQVITSGLAAPDEPLRLIASRRETKRLLSIEFVEYLRSHVSHTPAAGLVIEVADPSSEKGLQAVDCVSWCLFREYEYGDSTYADLIRPKVVTEIGALAAN